MKKVLLVISMLACIVGVFSVNVAQAQRNEGSVSSLPSGTGLMKAKYQYSPDGTAEYIFQTAMIALFSHEDVTAMIYFRDDLGLTCDDYRQIIANSIVDQSGYAIKNDATVVDLYKNHLSFYTAYKSHWDTHWDTYLTKGGGQKLTTFNPMTSNRFHRDHWRIARLTLPTSYGPADQSVYCANPTPAKTGIANPGGFDESFTQQTSPATTSNSSATANATVSVVFQKPNVYVSSDEHAASRNTNCHTLRTVAYCALAATTIITILELVKPHSKTVDNTYSTGFQGGSGSSGATGGTGSQQTW